MNKDTFYFSHDYNARTDDKIKNLIRKHGMLGYGIFWAIVEDLYNNTNALRLDYDGIAFDFRTTPEIIKSIINDFDLFCKDDIYFGSKSVETRLIKRNEKSDKARQSAFYRWNKDANVMRTQCERNEIKCERNAIKESKEKKIKKDIINTKFMQPSFEESKEYFHFLNHPEEVQPFLDFYESKGWMVGKNKMKNWQAAARNWCRNSKEFRKKNTTPDSSPPRTPSHIQKVYEDQGVEMIPKKQ